MKNKKKLIAVIVSVVLVLAILASVLIVRAVLNNRPPDLESVRGRFTELLLAAGEVNDILWGKGLATYPRVYEEVFTFKVTTQYDGEEKTMSGIRYLTDDPILSAVVAYRYYIAVSEDSGIVYRDFQNGETILAGKPDSYYRYARRTAEKEGDDYIHHDAEKGLYYYALTDFDPDAVFVYDEKDEPYYDFVRTDSGYLTTEDIKEKAAAVYSPGYLASVYESLFTGIATGQGTLFARYMDHENTEDGTVYLVKYNKDDGYDLTKWVYDFSTMQMVDESNAKFVTLQIERYEQGNEANRVTVTHQFALENGQWYLDSPSF
ncbi:MAG: hypothetical protein IJY50_01510 [Clostridia bacterium]|nr:hypothetical protein [Clostridia bacterium]